MSVMRDSASAQVGLETEDQTINQLNCPFQKYKQRLTLDSLRFGERYVKGELRLVFHARLAAKNYVTVLERFSGAGQAESGGPVVTVKNPDVGKFCDHCWHAHECDEQRMVLVDNIQIVDGPEVFTISTLVRFGSVNCIYSSLRHALYSSIPHGMVFRGMVPDRESGMPGVGRPVGVNELAGQVIKGTSEVMDHVSGDEADFGGRHLEVSNLEDVISRPRVVLGQDYIRMSFDELVPCELQITEVLLARSILTPISASLSSDVIACTLC